MLDKKSRELENQISEKIRLRESFNQENDRLKLELDN